MILNDSLEFDVLMKDPTLQIFVVQPYVSVSGLTLFPSPVDKFPPIKIKSV